jgi:hypothetical protein
VPLDGDVTTADDGNSKGTSGFYHAFTVFLVWG